MTMRPERYSRGKSFSAMYVNNSSLKSILCSTGSPCRLYKTVSSQHYNNSSSILNFLQVFFYEVARKTVELKTELQKSSLEVINAIPNYPF